MSQNSKEMLLLKGFFYRILLENTFWGVSEENLLISPQEFPAASRASSGSEK